MNESRAAEIKPPVKTLGLGIELVCPHCGASLLDRFDRLICSGCPYFWPKPPG